MGSKAVKMFLLSAVLVFCFGNTVFGESLVFQDDFSGGLNAHWISGTNTAVNSSPTVGVNSGRVEWTQGWDYIETKTAFSGNFRVEVTLQRSAGSVACKDFVIEFVNARGYTGALRLQYGSINKDSINLGQGPSLDSISTNYEGICVNDNTGYKKEMPTTSTHSGTATLTYADGKIKFGFLSSGGTIETSLATVGTMDETKIRIWATTNSRFVDDVKVYADEPQGSGSTGNPPIPGDPVVFDPGHLIVPETINVPAGLITIAPQLHADYHDVASLLMYIWLPSLNFGIDVSSFVSQTHDDGVLTLSLGTIDFSCSPGQYYIYYGYIDTQGTIHYQAYNLVVQPFSLPDSVIATGDYGAAFYLVDAATGKEVFNKKPGIQEVDDVTLSYDGAKIYFIGKETGAANSDLYSYDLPCADKPIKITSFGTLGTTNPDANPTSDTIVLEALAGGGTPHLYTVTPGVSSPVKISGDEQLVVEGADDPTVSWGDTHPAWSPDGSKIAYARLSKDTKGMNLAEISAIVTMNYDGSNKQVVYANQDGKEVDNVCWSYDGAYIIFTITPIGANNKDKQVMGIHLASAIVSDLTSGFASGGGVPESIWNSPDSLEVVYSPIEINPDLYKVTLEAHDGHLSVLSNSKLTSESHYREADWIRP